MQKYIGSNCPVCGKRFESGDDIVVCPECGTPHHRQCYKDNGKCANDELHGSFEWTPSGGAGASKAQTEQTEAGGNVCPFCGSENKPGSHYCSSCGAPLTLSRKQDPERVFETERERLYSETFMDESFNGITAEEAVEAIGTNTAYFLPRFKAIEKGANIIPNLCAFLFTYLYLFYRKMYGFGAAVMAVMLVLGVPQAMLDFAEIQDTYVSYGLLSQKIVEMPGIATITTFAVIASLLQWAIRILLLLFFNRLYFIKITGTVKGIKEGLNEANSYSEQMLSAFVKKKLGTSWVVPIVIICLTLAAGFAIAGWIVASPYFVIPEAGTLASAIPEASTFASML